MLSRRALLAFGSALALAPRRARAADTDNRKFLFVFAAGGWDPAYVFAPGLDPSVVDVDLDGETAIASGIPFVDNAARPSVRTFFERYGGSSSVVNGLEVRSLTHERCRQLILCGSDEGAVEDWPTVIASARADLLLPHLVLTGPAFAAANAASVVRLGANDQLAQLLSGTYADKATPPLATLSAGSSGRASAFARGRAEAWAAAQRTGQAGTWGADLLAAYERLDLCRDIAGDIATEGAGGGLLIPMPDRVQAALRCFSAGYSRCAMLEHRGLYERGWDTHTDIGGQGANFELLFSDLLSVLDDMAATAGTDGGSLLEETTVVVFSEMGRTPRMNSGGGKDHWTFTSALLIGAGIRGGQVVGGYEGGLVGRPVDLATGAVSDAGTALVPEHLGATLSLLAGIEPDVTGGAEPILALIADA